MSIEDFSNRQYANWSSQRTPGRVSPTKKPHPQNQLPVDYYSVAPPAVIQQRTTTSISSPSSSPENEKYLHPDDFISQTKKSDDGYSMINPSRLRTIDGDHIVFREESTHPDPIVGGEDTYQNLKFLNGRGGNLPDNSDSK